MSTGYISSPELTDACASALVREFDVVTFLVGHLEPSLAAFSLNWVML